MDSSYIVRFSVYMLSFIITMMGFSCIDFSKIILRGKTREAMLLHVLLAIATAKLVGDFLLAIII